MASRREKARFGDARQLSLPLGGAESFFRAPAFGYVFIGNDDAFGLLVAGAVWHDPAHEPGAALTPDFPLRRRLIPETCFDILQKSVVGCQGMQVRERAPDVARNHIKERSRCRRKEPNSETRIEKNRCDFGTVKHVLQIVRGRTLALERFL